MLTRIVLGESLPPNHKGQLKFNSEQSFTRMKDHPYYDQKISVPLLKEEYSSWGPGEKIPKDLRNEVDTVARNTYGDGIQMSSYRICWYDLPAPDLDYQQLMISRESFTPNQDFVISNHPHCENLYIAAGGSFHAFKFLPIIGRYVVMMMDGTLEDAYRTRWAWDRKNEGAACEKYDPARDITDIAGSESLSE